MEISKSKNTFITISIAVSDRPKSTALNEVHNWKVPKALSVKKVVEPIGKTASFLETDCGR